MKMKTLALLAILISLAGIGAMVVCLVLIPGIAVGPCVALMFLFLFFFVIGLYEMRCSSSILSMRLRDLRLWLLWSSDLC